MSNNTINDGGDGEDTGEFSQPFWTRAKSKAGKALTIQNARNNSNNSNNKQMLRLSDHDIHNPPGRDSRRRSYSDVTRSSMTCQFCVEPGHSTRDCGFGVYAKFRQCGQEGHKQNAVMPIPARIRARYALAMSLLTYHVKPMLRTLMMCVMCLHNIVYEHFQDYVIYLQDIPVLK